MKRMILTAGLGVLLTGCGHPEPADGSPTDGSPTPTTGTTPASCALGGGDGALWLVSYGPLRVHRIDLATCALETLAVDLGSQDLRGLELGAGALYLAGTDNIVRIDVASGDETARVDVNGSSLAFGDGRLFSSGSDRFLDERDLDTLDVVRSASDPAFTSARMDHLSYGAGRVFGESTWVAGGLRAGVLAVEADSLDVAAPWTSEDSFYGADHTTFGGQDAYALHFQSSFVERIDGETLDRTTLDLTPTFPDEGIYTHLNGRIDAASGSFWLTTGSQEADQIFRFDREGALEETYRTEVDAVSEPLTSHALAFRDATNTAWSVGAYLEDGTFTPHTVLFTLDTSTGEVTGATDFAGLSPSPEGLRWF